MRNKLKEKIILVTMLAIAFVLVLAGCGGFNKELDAPVPTFNSEKGIVNWDAVQDAKGYVVRSNNEIFEVVEPNYKLPGRGKYLIDVKAIPDNPNKFKPSKYSRIEVTYTSKIATPNVAITAYVGGGIKYIIDNYDEYASSYTITVNGVDYSVNTDRGVIDAKLDEGDYTVSVKGVGDNVYTTDSEVVTHDIRMYTITAIGVDYETMDTPNNLVVQLKHAGSPVLKVDANLYELDAKRYRYTEHSGKLTILDEVLLSYASREPLMIDVHYADGIIEVIKVNIIDNREPNFGESNYVTVYTAGDAIITFDIYRYDLSKVEMLGLDGTRRELVEGEGYDISYHLLSATLDVKTPNRDTDRGVIFTFTKGNAVLERTIEFYYQDSIPHVTSSHITYNAANANGDVVVTFDGGNKVTSVALKHAKAGKDYTIDNNNRRIVINRSYLDKFARGTVLTGRAYFGGEYGTFTIHVIDDVNVVPNNFKKSEYQHISGTSEDLVIETDVALTRSSLRAISLDGKIFNNNYVQEGNRLIFKAAYLNKLSYGFHELRLHISGDTNNSYDSVTTINILQPTNYVPLGVNVTIDNTYPYVAVNFVGTTRDTTSYVTNVSTNKTYYAKTGDTKVLVPYAEIDKGDKFTVSHVRGGRTGTTDAITYEGFNLGGNEKYYGAKFTYGGDSYDAVMTSEEELITFIHYGFMRVSKMRAYDAVGKETDPNDSMLWTASSRSGYEYSVRIYTPFYEDPKSNRRMNELIALAGDTYKEPTKGDVIAVEMGTSNVWEISFKVQSTNVPYHFNKEGHVPEAARYNYSYEIPYATNKPRSSVFDNFKINNWTKTQSVYLTDELYYAIEDGARPIPVEGSPAEKMYNQIKAIMRNLVDDTMTDTEKYLAILDWINHNVVYDDKSAAYEQGLNTTNYHLIYPRRCFFLEGVFYDGIAVCNGLAKAVTVMAGIEGINSMKIMGNVGPSHRTDPRHAWNKVYLDGIWYNSDPTWSSQVLTSPVVGGLRPEGINHRESLLSDKMFNPNNVHNADDRFKVVYANINFDFFANIITGIDSEGKINTLIMNKMSDVDAIFNAVKDEAVANGIIDIPVVIKDNGIEVDTELVTRFKAIDNRWQVVENRAVRGKYYYFDSYNIITLKLVV